MSIAEKLTDIAQNMQKVYDAGKANAVMIGETSFNAATKTLTITGLPAAPKRMNIYSCSNFEPTDDSEYFIRGLDYDADGFYYNESTSNKVLACLWLCVTANVSNYNALNASVYERVNTNNGIFTYDNGTFTIKMQSTNKYYFGENYTYRWTIVF